MNKTDKKTTYAAIDIGSNAVRLLIKQAKGQEADGRPHFAKMLLLRVPLRLGFDVFAGRVISPQKEKNMLRLMKSYRQLMKIYKVKEYRACATSAMRDAQNGPDIIKRIRKKTGIDIEIIDGQEEAQMVYNNHIEYMKDRQGYYMYIDVGGGSTEINLLAQGELVCSRSYNIGTVRILSNAVKDSEWTRIRKDMEELAKSYPQTDIIGSGGNINKLYRLAPVKDKAQLRMQVSTLRALTGDLQQLSVEERMEKYNLKADRADVIVPAGQIFLTIADIIHTNYIYVPVIGVADGIIDGLYARHQAAVSQ